MSISNHHCLLFVLAQRSLTSTFWHSFSHRNHQNMDVLLAATKRQVKKPNLSTWRGFQKGQLILLIWLTSYVLKCPLTTMWSLHKPMWAVRHKGVLLGDDTPQGSLVNKPRCYDHPSVWYHTYYWCLLLLRLLLAAQIVAWLWLWPRMLWLDPATWLQPGRKAGTVFM